MRCAFEVRIFMCRRLSPYRCAARARRSNMDLLILSPLNGMGRSANELNKPSVSIDVAIELRELRYSNVEHICSQRGDADGHAEIAEADMHAKYLK